MKYWASGYYGRGYIQLTWEKNYEGAGKALQIDLLGEPGLALEPAMAAKIAAWFFKANNIHKHCLKGGWEAVRRAVAGPGYHKDRAALGRFLGYCDRLGCSFGPGGGK
jgi:predicted chitinase